MLPDLVESFIRTHYGYGSLQGNFWLIGMEEACGESQAELVRRFEVWDALGRSETDDVAEYLTRLGLPQFFQEPVKLQHTWAHLIRLVLAAVGRPTDVNAVKAYQKNFLGRPGGATCLLELLPLPSPNSAAWHYGEWTGLPYLESREAYKQACIPWRAARLQEMIRQYRPPVVVFYGITYRKYYEQVSGCPFEPDGSGAEWAGDGVTLYLLVNHPAAWGNGANAGYFERVGREIRRRLGEVGEPTKSNRQEQPVEAYGLYKCEQCGKMVMGYDSVEHTCQIHRGIEPGYTQVGK